MNVTLRPLPAGRADLIEGLQLSPEQNEISDPPAVAMAKARGPREGHLICQDGVPVGFFAIDPDYARTHDFAEEGSIGLRLFSVDYRSQGRGIASAACRLLAGYLARHYPGTSAVYLTVDHRNAAAKRAYLTGGFEDTGEDYHGAGPAPHHVMRLTL